MPTRAFRSAWKSVKRTAAAAAGPPICRIPELHREVESLKLARTELERQAAATASEIRRQQIGLALEEIDRRLSAAAAS